MMKYIIICLVLFSQNILASNNTQQCFYKTSNGICIINIQADVYKIPESGNTMLKVKFHGETFLLQRSIYKGKEYTVAAVKDKNQLSKSYCFIAENTAYVMTIFGDEKIYCN